VNLAIRRHRLAPLVTVTVAALVFAILLIAVRLQWAPLESADHGAAASINHLVAGDATLASVVKAVTWLGSNGVLWTVIGAATVILAIRRQWRLAAYLLVTGAGALILDPLRAPLCAPPGPHRRNAKVSSHEEQIARPEAATTARSV
jgi:undecaprenyl-diphosphatase